MAGRCSVGTVAASEHAMRGASPAGNGGRTPSSALFRNLRNKSQNPSNRGESRVTQRQLSRLAPGISAFSDVPPAWAVTRQILGGKS